MTRTEEELVSRILKPLSVEDTVLVKDMLIVAEMRGFFIGAGIGSSLTVFVCWLQGG